MNPPKSHFISQSEESVWDIWLKNNPKQEDYYEKQLKIQVNNRNTVFIYVDGSYCGNTKIGVWTAIVVNHLDQRLLELTTAIECINSNFVEAEGIITAVNLYEKSYDKIYVYTDSLNFSRLFINCSIHPDSMWMNYEQRIEQLFELKRKNKLEIVWKPRNSIFEMKLCDDRSRLLLRLNVQALSNR